MSEIRRGEDSLVTVNRPSLLSQPRPSECPVTSPAISTADFHVDAYIYAPWPRRSKVNEAATVVLTSPELDGSG